MVQKITESHLRKMIKKIIRESAGIPSEEESAEISEKEVTRFTPYTPEEREQNFAPFRGGDSRSAFDRNPAYRRALEAARERQSQKKLGESRRINGIIDTVIKEYISRS